MSRDRKSNSLKSRGPGAATRVPVRAVWLRTVLVMLIWFGLDQGAPGFGAAWAKDGDQSGDSSGKGSGGEGSDDGSDNSGSSNDDSSDDDRSDDDGRESDDDDPEPDSGGRSGSDNGDKDNSGSDDRDDERLNKSSGAGAGSGEGSGRSGSAQDILQVRFADGRIEQVVNGRFERTDSRGRIVEQRRASRADLSRLGAYRLETEGTIQSVIQVSGKQSAAQLTDGSGWVETVAQGVYQLVDPNGNQVTRRKATPEDLSRIAAMAASR